VSEFRWSSFHEYINKSIITDVDFVLNMFSTDREKAIVLFEAFTNEKKDDLCLDYDEKVRVSDNEIRAFVLQHGVSDISQFLQLEKQERDKIIKSMKSVEGVTVRQLSRLTGMSKSVINRI